MKKLSTLILTLCALPAIAQTHFIGCTGSSTWTNIAAKNFPDKNSNRHGFAAGLTYGYETRRHFSFGAELKYEQRGFIDNIIFTDVNAKPTGRTEPIFLNYNYLSLPLKVGFSIGKGVYSFANVGVIPGLLLRAKVTEPVFDQNATTVGTAAYNITDRVTRFDLAGRAEIGLGYKFRNACAVFSSVAYQQSFTTITNDHYFSASTLRHYGTAVSVGVKCPLRRHLKKSLQLIHK